MVTRAIQVRHNWRGVRKLAEKGVLASKLSTSVMLLHCEE